MTATTETITGIAYEDTTIVLMARVTGLEGANIAQSDVSSITATVTDLSDNTPVAQVTLTKTDVVFNTLQTGGPWTKDATGYNFRYDLPYTYIPDGDRTSCIDIGCVMADSTRLAFEFRPKVKARHQTGPAS